MAFLFAIFGVKMRWNSDLCASNQTATINTSVREQECHYYFISRHHYTAHRVFYCEVLQ